MVLSKAEILAEIDNGFLDFGPAFSVTRVGASSVDLTLGVEFREFLSSAYANEVIDPSTAINPAYPDILMSGILARHTRQRSIDDEGYILVPNKLILGQTEEYLKLPPSLAARVEGKSSLARLGVSVHATAPTVQAGYEGVLTLEINCVGPRRLLLTPGLSVAQLILERVNNPNEERYEGQYLRQGIPT